MEGEIKLKKKDELFCFHHILHQILVNFWYATLSNIYSVEHSNDIVTV